MAHLQYFLAFALIAVTFAKLKVARIGCYEDGVGARVLTVELKSINESIN